MVKTLNDCPQDGDCTLKIFKNKRMVVRQDQTGRLFYTKEDNLGKSVIVYEYKRRTDPELQDGQYREEVIFEITNDTKKISLADKELGQVNMLFGRLCYCKGQTGYYYVRNGNMNLLHENGVIILSLNFKIEEVPQIISQVQGSIK